jgi:hypothetical protein
MSDKDRRAMIDKDELRAMLSEVINEVHCHQFDADDTHDIRELLKIYRETTSTFRRWLIRGFIIACFLIAAFIASIKFGFVKGP